MNIDGQISFDEAISRLHTVKTLCEYGINPGDASAVQLGIEALNAIKQYRLVPAYRTLRTLPGETEE